nr:hypothetical protein [Tanacetum cinerariifolium]
MTILADKAILLVADNRPPMMEKVTYDSWKSRMELYVMSRQHGRMILESVENDLLIWHSIEENGVYAFGSNHKVAKELWERIQLLMKEVLTINYVSIVKTDKVIHTAKSDMVKLVVEIDSFGMSTDELDKETGSSAGLQPKQADLSCVHALNELHLHEIHVFPSMHEADQYALAEVHNHDNVNNNMINQAVHAMPFSEQSNIVNLSETEITNDSNIIPYSQKFTSLNDESLESYYSRFYKMMNKLIRNQCKVTNHQVNVQFLLQLQPEWQRFVTLVKQSQELKTVSYHKLYDILKQHQHEVNEIRAEKIARVANPLTLVAQQQPVYHPQNHPTHYIQNSQPDHNKLLHRTEEKQLSILYNPSMIKNLLWLLKMMKLRECQKPKRAKDAAYHREKMLLCKQEEAGIQLNAEQTDWRDDTNDDELEDQELEAHYMYMAQLQEVSPDVVDSRPIFDDELVQKVSNDDHYNVFTIESVHPEQSKPVHDTYPIEQDAQNVIIDS